MEQEKASSQEACSQEASSRDNMSLVDHLGELRRRIIVAVVALVIGMVAAFIAQDWVFSLIRRPLRNIEDVSTQLVTFSPTEPFLTVIKVSAYAGFMLALPVILSQIWAYIMLALFETEKKAVLPYVALTFLLFAAGVAFGYFLVLPVGLEFLVGYGGDIFLQQLRANEYISFVILFLLGFGTVFEMPAVVLLVRYGGGGRCHAQIRAQVRGPRHSRGGNGIHPESGSSQHAHDDGTIVRALRIQHTHRPLEDTQTEAQIGERPGNSCESSQATASG